MTFNLGDAIRKVRAVEARIKQEEDAFEEKIKEFKDYAKAKRAEILSHLLATGQKSANTEYGTAYWKEKVTYQVRDKDEFKRHVIGMEEWELLSWAAASVAAEDYTKANGHEPPGLFRNAVVLPYITAPAKPALRVAKASSEELNHDAAE